MKKLIAINFDKYIFSKKTHYISNSGKDENGRYKGGTAGDQNGHEWELKKWYNRPWTVVLRYPNQAVALTIAKLSVEAALNDNIGYDQGQRTTYWQQLKKAKYCPSAITVGCEEDCTAGVSSNVKAAGYLHGIDALAKVAICSSRNMRAKFTAAGFKALTDSKYLTSGKYLLPGDILLYENHHAAANVTCGTSVLDKWNPDKDIVNDVKPETMEASTVVSFSGRCYVRSGPNKDAKAIAVVGKGETLPFNSKIDSETGWLGVVYEGKNAWVSPKYAKVVEAIV